MNFLIDPDFFVRCNMSCFEDPFITWIVEKCHGESVTWGQVHWKTGTSPSSNDPVIQLMFWWRKHKKTACAVRCCRFFLSSAKLLRFPRVSKDAQETCSFQTKNIQKDIFLCLVAPLSLLSPLPSWPLIKICCKLRALVWQSFQLSFKHSAGSSSIARWLLQSTSWESTTTGQLKH